MTNIDEVQKANNKMFQVFMQQITNKINQLNLTQKEVAAKLSISESMFSKIISGQRKIELNKLKELSCILELDEKKLYQSGIVAGLISFSNASIIKNISGLFAGEKGNTEQINSIEKSTENPYDADYKVIDSDSSTDKNEVLNNSMLIFDEFSHLEHHINDFASTTIKELQEIYQLNIKLIEYYNKLKDYRQCLEFSLRGKVTNEFIEKICKYIDMEIEMNKL